VEGRGGCSGTTGALIPTIANRILTPFDTPEWVRQTRGRSGAFEDADFSSMIQAAKGELYFCVDGGGSRSRGRFVGIEGTVFAEANGGPCNPSTNLERAVASVVDLWSHCCSVIGRPNNQFKGVVFAVGAAGAYIDVGKDFLSACPPFARSCWMSDGYAALIGADFGAPCSLLIIGTGVAGHRLYANGRSIQRGAWGWSAGIGEGEVGSAGRRCDIASPHSMALCRKTRSAARLLTRSAASRGCARDGCEISVRTAWPRSRRWFSNRLSRAMRLPDAYGIGRSSISQP
jgi:hypothetical protein